MGNSLSVSVGANVSDIHTKMALAQADVRNFTAEVKTLTAEMATNGDANGQLLGKLQATVKELSEAKERVSDLRAEMKEMSGEGERAGGTFVSLRETTEGLNARLTETKELASGLGEVFLAGLGGEKLLELVSETAEFGEAMEQASHETGLTTAELQALRYEANHAGVDFDTLQRGIAQFGSNTDRAVAGSKRQQAAFEALGITTAELKLHGDDAMYMLERVAGALDQYEDGQRKGVIVTDLFSQKLRDMGPVLHALAQEGIGGLMEKNAQLGGQFSGEFVEDAAKAETALKDFRTESNNLWLEVGSHLLPVLTAAERAFSSIATARGRDSSELERYRGLAKGLQDQIAQLQGEAGQHSKLHDFFFQPIGGLKALQDELDRVNGKITELEGTAEISKPIQITHDRKDEKFKPEAPDVGDLERSMQEADKLKREAYERTISMYQAEASAFGASSEQRIAILKKEQAVAISTWGDGSTQANEIQKEINSATREGATQRAQIAAQETAEFIKTKDQELTAFIQHESALVQQKKITVDDAEKAEKGLTAKIFDEERKRLDLAIQMAGDDIALWTKLTNQKLALAQKETDQLQKITDKAADERAKKEEATDKAIAKSGATTITGLITGRTTLLQAVDSLAEKGLEKVIEYGLEELARSIGIEGLKTAATAAGEQARNAAKVAGQAEGKAIEATSGAASVFADANKAAAGAYAAVSQIPVVGPILAPAAAAAAFVAVEAFDVFSAESGALSVPYDNAPFLLHEREMVLPADFADPLRDMLSGKSSAVRSLTTHQPDFNQIAASFAAAGGIQGSGSQGGASSGNGITHNWDFSNMNVGSGTTQADIERWVTAVAKKIQRNPALAGF